MPTCKDVLNEVKWRHDALSEVTVVVLHRGAPGDQRSIAGAEIVALGHSFFTVAGPDGPTEIPPPRILRIERGAETVWARAEDHPSGGA